MSRCPFLFQWSPKVLSRCQNAAETAAQDAKTNPKTEKPSTKQRNGKHTAKLPLPATHQADQNPTALAACQGCTAAELGYHVRL